MWTNDVDFSTGSVQSCIAWLPYPCPYLYPYLGIIAPHLINRIIHIWWIISLLCFFFLSFFDSIFFFPSLFTFCWCREPNGKHWISSTLWASLTQCWSSLRSATELTSGLLMQVCLLLSLLCTYFGGGRINGSYACKIWVLYFYYYFLAEGVKNIKL